MQTTISYFPTYESCSKAATQCIEKGRQEDNFIYSIDTPNLSGMGGHKFM